MGKSIWFASTSPWGLIPSAHVKNPVWLHVPVTLALGGGRYRWISRAILSDSLVGKKKKQLSKRPGNKVERGRARVGRSHMPTLQVAEKKV